MGCCKCLCVLLNLATLILSGVLLGVGITALWGDFGQASGVFDGGRYRAAAIGTTVTGAVVLLLLKLDYCGLLLRNRCLLGVLISALLILFVVVETRAVIGHVGGDDLLVDEIAAKMNKSISEYNEDVAVQHVWDFLQRELQCCGVDNGTDWSRLLGHNQVPVSCCENNSSNSNGTANSNGTLGGCTASNGSYKKGCAEKLKDFIEANRTWLVAVATAAASLILLTLIGYCIVIQGRNNEYTNF